MPLRLENVYKIGGTPTITFVQPIEYPSLLVALRTPGRGVVVEGPSGIGKTTSVTRALGDLDVADSIVTLSARKPADIEFIHALPTMDDFGTVIIDDFHRLAENDKRLIADLMKVLADEENPSNKLVVLGINKAGDSLIQFAHDLNNRIEVIKLEANPDEKVLQLVGQGESALNVSLNVKDDIAAAANGSFYIAQMLSHQTCMDSGILEQQSQHKTTQVSFELTRSKVFDRLSRTFMERTQVFARGTRFRREGRAPYLHLLYWLANSEEWSLSINKAIRDNPTLTGSVTQIVENGYLADLLKKHQDLAAVLHFDSKSRQLTVEDPQYVYFLRNISWSRFAEDAGFITMEFPSRYDFALSFAGEDRAHAAALYEQLIERELEVFYDKNEQHRILAEDVEDYLRPIYQSDAEYVVVLLGPAYPSKIWTKFESDQFKQRFHDGEVVPIWFTTAPPGAFDQTIQVGGIRFDPNGNASQQLKEIAELLSRKLRDSRSQKC